jgi:hypothetical protein
MTIIKPGSSMQRTITIPGIPKPVNVAITTAGLEFWVKGARTTVFVSWYQAVKAGNTPVDVPSFLMDHPLELLQHQAAKSKKKA